MRFATLVRLCVIALVAGLLHVVAAAPASAAVPIGDVNYVVSNQPGRVSIRGWTFDPDTPSRYVDVHFYLGPTGNEYGINLGPANTYRPDVNAPQNYPGAGEYHGFDTTFDVPLHGDLVWNLFAIDAEGNPLIESGRVTIADPSPIGRIESGSSSVHRTVDIAGWASDPNAPSTATAVGVYVGGPVGTPGVEVTRVPANLARPDGKPGFSARLSTAKTGTQPVYVYAANLPGTPGNDALIGKVDVAIFVDSTAPETKINSAPTVATPQDVIAITFSADDPNATFGCRWDSAAFETCSGATSVSLPPGEHTFQVRATDKAGNTDPTPASAVVVVSNYVTQPLPLPVDDRAIRLDAVKKKSKLRIDVDSSADGNYRVIVQRKTGKKWVKARKVRTRGNDAVVVVDLPRGKYRVVLPRRDLDPAITSTAVRLKR